MTSKTFTAKWVIKGTEVKIFKKHQTKYNIITPPIFVGSLPFYIEIMNTSNNVSNLYLHCDTIYDIMLPINIKYIINIDPIKIKYSQTCKFGNSSKKKLITDAIETKEILGLNKITINISLTIIQDSIELLKVHDNVLLTTKLYNWEFNNNDIKKMKESKIDEQIFSTYKYMGDMVFYIGVYPNGWKNKGYINIYLYCKRVGFENGNIKIWCYTDIESIGYKCIQRDTLEPPYGSQLIKRNWIKSDKLNGLDIMKISVIVQIQCISNECGIIIPVDKWNKYIYSTEGNTCIGSDKKSGKKNIDVTIETEIKNINDKLDNLQKDYNEFKQEFDALKEQIQTMKSDIHRISKKKDRHNSNGMKLIHLSISI